MQQQQHTSDHPFVRSDCVCPVCHQAKDKGLLVCWRCYRAHNLRTGGSVVAIHCIERQEAIFAQNAKFGGWRGELAARTELTPIGEQYVIPGCEKHERPSGSQLKLWER